ncbi:hypothetical protein LV164_007534 [Aspergillus fumigatus]|nr:hypothetical protein KXX42_007143 [Aspergillus fumigatus]KAH1553274.1 hypothetical protein KXX57_006912 [Aspergillus fumigatus]KAH1978277.1 hypothetical protein KXW88_007812 [Aspergillus fumigatus]KAH2664958.1 hypothetical protein KXV32_007576 [Aspergillus fumigatus]KAH2758353.1 hypothetical protein KXV94_008344 [Aspergillus fumigatus]
MVELRKRKAPSQNPATKKKSKRLKETASEETSPTLVQSSKEDERSTHVSHKKPPTVGDTIDLDNFGGEIELNDGTKTTLKHLVDTSKSGIVLFTYPRASTPGCACDEIRYLKLSLCAGVDVRVSGGTVSEKQNVRSQVVCPSTAILIPFFVRQVNTHIVETGALGGQDSGKPKGHYTGLHHGQWDNEAIVRLTRKLDRFIIMTRDVLKAAKSASNAIAVHKKYTVQSTGIWERLRRLLAIDPNRSTGVPLNSQYRLPTPGALPPQSYDDPVTVPAADIADNPYWKRDVRRNYPRLSIVNQADAVGLLTVGSRAAPKDDVLQTGQAGEQQLVEVKQQGEERGLAAIFEKDKRGIQGVLGADGLPPTPCNLNASAAKYQLGQGQGYPAVYPCRTFV